MAGDHRAFRWHFRCRENAVATALMSLFFSSPVFAQLSGDGDQVWSQLVNVSGNPADGDQFGAVLATGDFDGDSYDDLAIGVPFDEIGGDDNAGSVNIIYGSGAGLDSVGNQLFHQDTEGMLDSAEPGDQFGEALAVGDFNSDGFDDLAIGVPEEGAGSSDFAGAVVVLFGSVNGLTIAGNQRWFQGTQGLTGDIGDLDLFGRALAAGDFDTDGYDDLAVGVPGEQIGSNLLAAGAVHIIYGSSSGLNGDRDEIFDQNSPGILGTAERGDQFGSSLAVGRFDSDNYDDLAVGAPKEGLNGSTGNNGAVHVLYGSPVGITDANNQLWALDNPALTERPRANTEFGATLAAGRVNGDTLDDLVIGAPMQLWNGVQENGFVNVLFGGNGGVTTDDHLLLDCFTEDEGDECGGALAVSPEILVIAMPESNSGAGAIRQYRFRYGTGSRIWRQGIDGLAGTEEDGDGFGYALAFGHFNDDEWPDLAVGAPFEDYFEGNETYTDGGIVQVLYGEDWYFPEVAAVLPFDGETNVSLEPVISVIFDEPISAAPGGFIDLRLPLELVERFELDSDVQILGNTITFSPTAPLLPGRTYEVAFSAGQITDATGNFNASYSWNFSTRDIEAEILSDGFEP